MAGGAPMYVTSLSAMPWPHPYTVVPGATIAAMPQYPADGTKVRNYGNGGIYVVAGGFPFGVSSLGNVPPSPGWVDVDG
ncbi:hypothetical protein [Dactylosporangium matsuzakiense]|uniref:Uncharacterized protein n=1 Tax=Dactylosporangium matsuzakiense TaxID=53360 RepID=A0A9W6KKR8_9ACTN|nr:hypothetical protein [Dactylosporangium matsuzakiense]UWZ43245.1 hypothetical protein Dmats_38070 [Dactylosporangium matsuzakiense]GLL02655.1 hypothetical protein GCM10017581_043970 [Dactylosporangium matsuzakiense]